MVRSSTGAAGTDLTAGDVVLAYLGAQVDVVLAGAEEARAGDADAVHRVRVAIRRLRSTLRTFRPLLDRERSEPLREELRRLGGVLGALRDVQVVRDTRAALPGQDGRVAERLDRLLSQRGRTAHAAVTGALAGPWWDRLRAGLEQLRSRPPLSARADRPASEELTRLVRRADRRVRRRYRAAQVAISPAERDRLHHEVRKAAKRARYAAEAVAPAVGEPARRYAAGMERVQEALGDERDAVTLGELLAGLVETTSTEREAADLAAVAERCRARAADARAAFVEVWREVARESGWPRRPR